MWATFSGWVARIFGYGPPPVAAPASELLDDAARTARDYLLTLQDGTRPVPMPYSAVEHQRAMAAKGVQAAKDAQATEPFPYPPTCPASLPPSAPPEPLGPPPGPPVPAPPWHQASVHYPVDQDYPPVTLPLEPSPLPPRPRLPSRASSGPPPRMPRLAIPIPPRGAPVPGKPAVPRPTRKR